MTFFQDFSGYEVSACGIRVASATPVREPIKGSIVRLAIQSAAALASLLVVASSAHATPLDLTGFGTGVCVECGVQGAFNTDAQQQVLAAYVSPGVAVSENEWNLFQFGGLVTSLADAEADAGPNRFSVGAAAAVTSVAHHLLFTDVCVCLHSSELFRRATSVAGW